MPLTLNEQGLSIQTLAEIKGELEAAFKDSENGFGPEFDVSPQSVAGQLIGIWSEREAYLQTLVQGIYTSADPIQAVGHDLDRQGALVGAIREPAKKSTIELRIHGDADTELSAGTKLQYTPNETLWVLDEDITLPPEGGSGYVDTTATAKEFGPTVATPSSVWEFVKPNSSISAIESTNDAVVGRNLESDQSFRYRILSAPASLGNSSLRSIAHNLRQDVPEIAALAILHNPTPDYDGEGLPPFSVEVVIDGGDDQAIFDSLAKLVAAGTQTHGDVQGNSVLAETGQTFAVAFSRPAETELHLQITAGTSGAITQLPDAGIGYTDTIESIKQALVAYGATLDAGMDVEPLLLTQVVLDTVPSRSLTSLSIQLSDDGSTWQPTAWTIGLRELAKIDSERITIGIS